MDRIARVYSIIENAGYEDEAFIASYLTFREALAAIRENYDADEIESLHVQVRTDFADGTQEYQS